MSYLIVVSDFNPEITEPLLEACLKGFKEQGLKAEVVHVPGAVEIPLALQQFISYKKPLAAVALGCVIKGATEHYEYVCDMCSRGIMDTMLKTQTPIVFEVLMVDTEKKAEDRIEKGYHAAYSAVKMASLLKPFRNEA
jgi:6,7-dimethyl-8-ribityllumazine synthase